jgi:Aldo/keto reductase family
VHALGRADALCVSARRGAEQAAVLAAELGRAVIADRVRDLRDVVAAGDQRQPGPLEPDRLLVLDRGHVGDRPEVPVEGRFAHPGERGELPDPNRFVRGGFDYSTLDAVGNPNYLRQSAHMSARRLGVDAIDLYYLHSGRALDAPFEDQVGVLAELRQAGLVRHVGLSDVTLEQLRTAQSIVPVAAVTALYNVTARPGADLLAAAEADGIVFSPWHPVTTTDGPLALRAA